MCAGRVAACEVFWGLGFRKIPSGAAVVVKAATKCQYYFFKFLKNVLCCDCGAEHASKQILHSLQALQHEHSSRLLLAEDAGKPGTKRGLAEKSRFHRLQRDGYGKDFARRRIDVPLQL